MDLTVGSKAGFDPNSYLTQQKLHPVSEPQRGVLDQTTEVFCSSHRSPCWRSGQPKKFLS